MPLKCNLRSTKKKNKKISTQEEPFAFLHRDAPWLPLVRRILGPKCKLIHTGAKPMQIL
jgi:hypothetical protein